MIHVQYHHYCDFCNLLMEKQEFHVQRGLLPVASVNPCLGYRDVCAICLGIATKALENRKPKENG